MFHLGFQGTRKETGFTMGLSGAGVEAGLGETISFWMTVLCPFTGLGLP